MEVVDTWRTQVGQKRWLQPSSADYHEVERSMLLFIFLRRSCKSKFYATLLILIVRYHFLNSVWTKTALGKVKQDCESGLPFRRPVSSLDKEYEKYLYISAKRKVSYYKYNVCVCVYVCIYFRVYVKMFLGQFHGQDVQEDKKGER